MPEPYWPKRKQYLISEAMKHARYASMKCPYCKRLRYFLLSDLKRLLGDIDCDAITYGNKWRCGGCDSNMTLDLRLESDLPIGTTITRLAEIYHVRRIRWRTEVL